MTLWEVLEKKSNPSKGETKKCECGRTVEPLERKSYSSLLVLTN